MKIAKLAASVVAILLLPGAVFAGEPVSGTSFYVVDQRNYPITKGAGYWIWNAEGIHHSEEGPLGTDPVECHGAGFWDRDGSSGEGICIIGDGDDVLIDRWWCDKGEQTCHWEIVSGSGEFAGMTGSGTSVTRSLPGNRSISQWRGEVSPAR